MWISPSLEVCVRSGRKRDTVWNHQHILGFEDPIQTLLSLCLWLTPAVSNIWHSQTLSGTQENFYEDFLYPFSQVEINVLHCLLYFGFCMHCAT